ncbi:hypothetical protein SANTM175S_01561 [Streptomyces antimycoticus]
MLVELFVDRITVAKAKERGGTDRTCRVEDRVTVVMASSSADADEGHEAA